MASTVHVSIPLLGSSLTEVTRCDRGVLKRVASMPTMLGTSCSHKRLNEAAEDTSPELKVSHLAMWGMVLMTM